jgi:hypothetical protein
MSRERRDWNKVDPLQYFKDTYAGKFSSRSEFQKADGALYGKLRSMGMIEQLFPQTVQRDWSKIDAVAYFKEKYPAITMPCQLANKDPMLYKRLLALGKIGELMPKGRRVTVTSKHRDWSKTDPVKEFRSRYAGIVKTKKQLMAADNGLYIKLRRMGVLDELLNDTRRDWTKDDPVGYYLRHYSGKIKTRAELISSDAGLYYVLNERKLLGKLLPDKNEKDRDWSKTDPVTYFRERFAGKIASAGELISADYGLYQILRARKLLSAVFPSDDKKQLEDLMDDFGGAR